MKYTNLLVMRKPILATFLTNLPHWCWLFQDLFNSLRGDVFCLRKFEDVLLAVNDLQRSILLQMVKKIIRLFHSWASAISAMSFLARLFVQCGNLHLFLKAVDNSCFFSRYIFIIRRSDTSWRDSISSSNFLYWWINERLFMKILASRLTNKRVIHLGKLWPKSNKLSTSITIVILESLHA